MNRLDRFTLLPSIIVLCITAVFTVFVVSIIYQPGLASIVITIVTCLLVALFLVALTLVGIVLLIVVLADRIHHYSVLHDRRELQRKQPLGRRKSIARNGYRYEPRRPYIRRIQLNNQTHNGC